MVESFGRNKHVIRLLYYYLLGDTIFFFGTFDLYFSLHRSSLSCISSGCIQSIELISLVKCIILTWCCCSISLRQLDVMRTEGVQRLLQLIMRILWCSRNLTSRLRSYSLYEWVHLRLLFMSSRIEITLWRVRSLVNNAIISILRSTVIIILSWKILNLVIPTLDWLLRSLIDYLLGMFGLHLDRLSDWGVLRILMLMISYHWIHILLSRIYNW